MMPVALEKIKYFTKIAKTPIQNNQFIPITPYLNKPLKYQKLPILNNNIH